jgi:hypothetical protein
MEAATKRVQHLHESVGHRLRQAKEGVVAPEPFRWAASLPTKPARFHIHDISRDPDAARQAFIASMVLGTPKGLEE